MKLTKLHFLCFLSLLYSVCIFAQDLTIDGTVTDEDGMPIPGATIILKNTTKGTTTDFDGKFQIMAPSDGILVIQYIGYATIETQING